MYKIVLVLSLCIMTVFGWSQRPQYKISASLDNASHTLSGTINITYTNNSKRALDSLGIHLWPDAYSRKNTALANQMIGLNNFIMHNAYEHQLGGFAQLAFSSPDQKVRLVRDPIHFDIGWMLLTSSLQPGASIHLTSTYTLKIPNSFSRLGRTGTAYQLTQWYPHMAVLDAEGWHTMPYLDQGEYFNDFSDYDVSIKVPSGYTVAATGSLVSKTNLSNSTQWNFKAENVIDFAWFTSSTFVHQTREVELGGENPVIVNIYTDSNGLNDWEKAIDYAVRALRFYSEWLGPYPYPQMSVVYTPGSKAGFMEYPMLAQIGATSDSSFLDLVIAHEIGHTWLYGILANNERVYPWLDEGLNTFLEKRYMDTYHPGYAEIFFPSVISTSVSMPHSDALQHLVRFNRELQPPYADPVNQTSNQYLFSAYILPAQGLEMLYSMKGEAMTKKMFKQYYTDHQFTHVTPLDLELSFEDACSCDLKWFFQEWLHHAHEVDYRLKKFNKRDKEITIENHGLVHIPVQLTAYKDGDQVLNHWLDGFSGEKIIHLDHKADEVRLFEDVMAINKNWRRNIKPRSLIPHIGFFPKIGSYEKRTLDITPFFGYNVTDGFMPGIAFTSGLLPQKGFKWIVAPMYGVESKEIRGHAEGRFIDDFKSGYFDKYLLSVSYDRFGYNLDTHYLFRDAYQRWSPIVALRVHQSDRTPHITQWWKYRYVHIDQNYGQGLDFENEIFALKERNYDVHELSYQMSSMVPLKPFKASANLQTGKGFLRLNLKYQQQFVGKSKMRGVWIRGFGGWLPIHERTDASVLFTINGTSSNGFFARDYMYDEWLGGRNANSGSFSRQVFIKDAGLKTLANTGLSDQWMVGGGVSVSMPVREIHVYMDAAFFPSDITEKLQFSYSGGLAIVLLKDVFEIYIPILESKDILDSIIYEERDRWFDRVNFQANFKLGNPLNLIDHLQLGY